MDIGHTIIELLQAPSVAFLTDPRAARRLFKRVKIDAQLYGELWAEFYDDIFGSRDSLDGVVTTLQGLSGSGRVLEFGVGTGRLALPLAARGVDVHGIDFSQPMLDKLHAKAGGAQVTTTLGDFTEIRVDGDFSLVLLAFSAIFMLDSQEQQVRCFANAARHLEKGGVFVVEAFVPDHSRWIRGQNISVVRVEKDLVDLNAGVHDRAAQEIVYARIFLRESGITLLPTRLRYAWPSELDLMARLAGMRLRERWSNWQGAEFTSESEHHISIYELA
jgi:SAM-dependent methyltransferase